CTDTNRAECKGVKRFDVNCRIKRADINGAPSSNYNLTSGENDLGPVFAIQRRTTWGRGETGQQCIERWE
ncbi:hypothetical protein L917_00015, partial [Phytophthora nicotianae]